MIFFLSELLMIWHRWSLHKRKSGGKIELKLAADDGQQEVEGGWQGNCQGHLYGKGNQKSVVPQGAGSVRRNGLRGDNQSTA
jgi:hypothetical protein